MMSDDHSLLRSLVDWFEIFAASLLGNVLLLLALATAFALAGAVGGLGGMALLELRLAGRGGVLDALLLGAWALLALAPLAVLLRSLWSGR